ncbi:MAG: UDP-N-acetylmuramate dehydrogenase [Clostridiales bacterium]|nr:UDP-N-acetylmuramate dehydrogenase [Clostridiales bacterium]
MVGVSSVLRGEPLKNHTTFKIGGPVELLVTPKSRDQLISVCTLLIKSGIAPLILGNGSNILAADGWISRIAVKTDEGNSDTVRNGDIIWAGSGVLLSRLSMTAQRNGLTGLEFAYGIPGTLGGAVYMNAGAYGSEMKEIVLETEVIDAEGQIKTLTEHDFAYRRSRFFTSGEIILSSRLKLQFGEAEQIMQKMGEFLAKRKASQPLDVPSAGSVFKRPKAGFAAALIDEAGLKGFSIGGAEVSAKHAGFIVNRNGATCDDVLRLIEHVVKTVQRIFGVELEPEIRYIR